MSSHYDAISTNNPIARIIPLLNVAHLDREFDYLVPKQWDSAAQPGTLVRIRFGHQLTEGFIWERCTTTDYPRRLNPIQEILSPLPLLTNDIRQLIDSVAHHYAGNRSDVIRLAIPPRHPQIEREIHPISPPITKHIDERHEWNRYQLGEYYLHALRQGKAARAVWQALPGESWTQRFIDLAIHTLYSGQSVLLLVPDQRDITQLYHVASQRINPQHLIVFPSKISPRERYRRWFKVRQGHARVVIGARRSVFVPLEHLGLIAIWDDGDEMFSELQAPYPHSRDVAICRAHLHGCALLLGGYSRTVEAHQLVTQHWAHNIVASASLVASVKPRIIAIDETRTVEQYRPIANATRLPTLVLEVLRQGLRQGNPVLVQVPRRGYIPTLSCQKCHTIARCRYCTGPLGWSDSHRTQVICGWCGKTEHHLHCVRCGSTTIGAVIVGAQRTAEEFSAAFPNTTIIHSYGDHIVDSIDASPVLVIATPGAEPIPYQGYSSAILLDPWALLSRQDLRASEDTLRRWMTAAALVRPRRDGGVVVIIADSQIPTVRAFVQWDPLNAAQEELRNREEVNLPPSVHVAAIDGLEDSINFFLTQIHLPPKAEILGPVPLPAGVLTPSGLEHRQELVRILIRVPKNQLNILSQAIRDAVKTLSSQKSHQGLSGIRIQIDPIHIG